MATGPEITRAGMVMNVSARNCNRETHRSGDPAAMGCVWLWKLVLAAGVAALGGCCLPRVERAIPLSPTEPAPFVALQGDVETILERMEAAWEEVKDYQVQVEAVLFEKDGSSKSEITSYTFKKPKWIRIDLLSPHPGMVMVYPDRNGKVLVKPRGVLSVFPFHLSLDAPLLQSPSGQRMDQTDMGVLIRNIRHSVTDQRRGPVSLSENMETIQIKVLADDHFRQGVETEYRFLINKELRLPAEVDASTTNGVQQWRFIFRNLRTNINVPDSLFQ